MEERTIGRIERVHLREVWPHEALDFTRWLGENLDILSEELGITLTDAETEGPAGDFSVDVVARDDADRTVVIENQLERSDHDHLGKLVTYLAMMGAEAAIWIVSEARPEHVSAVSWLNENSSADFYLVQVEAVRIGDSLPAPLVRRIVGPSSETRVASKRKREMSERHEVRQGFWRQLLQRALDKGVMLHANASPPVGDSVRVSAGVKGIRFGYGVASHSCRVELYIDRGPDAGEENKQIFDKLYAAKEEIEAEFGAPLVWERLDDTEDTRGESLFKYRASLIRYYMDKGGYRDPEERWPEIQDAMIDAMVRLEAALRPHIDALDI